MSVQVGINTGGSRGRSNATGGGGNPNQGGGGGDGPGGAYAVAIANYMAARETNAANKQIAADNRAFQKVMAGTAHQREVKDLVRAGLNPILSANNGAAVPQGSTATMENEMAPAIASALEAMQLQMAMEKQKSEIGLLDAQTAKTATDTVVAQKGIPESDIKNRAYRLVNPILNKVENAFKSSAKPLMSPTPPKPDFSPLKTQP